MKKISLKSISDVLSSKELKNIKGGSGYCYTCGGSQGFIPTYDYDVAWDKFAAICQAGGQLWFCGSIDPVV